MLLPASGQHSRTTSEDTLALIRRLAPRYDDTTIAQILGNQNRRTATGLPFRKAHVRALRAYHGIPGYQPPAENVTPGRNDAAAASTNEVSVCRIPRWLRGSGTRAGCPARLGHWPASTARSPAGRSSSFSKAGLISDDDTAGTAFREDHGT